MTLPSETIRLIMFRLWLSIFFLNSFVFALSPRANTTVAAGWYTSWHASVVPLDQLSWSKYTHLIYAFAVTTPDITTLGFTDLDHTLIPQFVNYAYNHNVIPMLSVGGYTGSRWFSSHVQTPENRAIFTKTLTDVVQMYNFGGIEIDWEFPNSLGVGCNVRSGNDTTNFLAFLRGLRNTTVGHNITLSAAVWYTPWLDSSGYPSKNVSDFSQVLDFVTIMNYDIASNSSFGAGPSSPLDDSCAPVSAQRSSAKSAVSAWTASGFPKNQLVLGVPSYGHSFSILPGSGQSTSALPLYPPYSTIKVHGDKWDSYENATDVCGVQVGAGGTYEYWGLMQGGFLNPDGSPQAGIQYRFDNCSKTPFVYNATSKIYVSYENPESFAYKGEYIRAAGLRGFSMWEVGGDYKDALLDSIINGTNTSSLPLSSSPSIAGAAKSHGVPLSSRFTWFWISSLVIYLVDYLVTLAP